MAQRAFQPDVRNRRFRDANNIVIPGVWRTNEYRVNKPAWREMLNEPTRRKPYVRAWRNRLLTTMQGHGVNDREAINSVLGRDAEQFPCLVCGNNFPYDTNCGQPCWQRWQDGPMRRLENDVEIREMPPRASIQGYGAYLKAGRSLGRGEYVGEYVGELLPNDPPGKKPAPDDSRYVFEVDDDWLVDAERHGNESRFFNHHCDPNVTSEVSVIGGRRVIALQTLRPIQAGEQLTLNYGYEYFKDWKLRCKCDAPHGLGMDHLPPVKTEG